MAYYCKWNSPLDHPVVSSASIPLEAVVAPETVAGLLMLVPAAVDSPRRCHCTLTSGQPRVAFPVAHAVPGSICELGKNFFGEISNDLIVDYNIYCCTPCYIFFIFILSLKLNNLSVYLLCH